MRAMMLAAALLALPAAVAAQDPDAPLPLHPAGVALVIAEEPNCTALPDGGTACAAPRLVIPTLRPCTAQGGGAAGCKTDRAIRATTDPSAGGRDPELLSIDGVDVRGRSARRAAALLTGPAGSRATLVWQDGAGRHTLVHTRTVVFAPGPGYTQAVVTRHFVLHVRPREVGRARALAAHAERLYARTGYPTATGGRRAHYWVVSADGERYPKAEQVAPAVWGAWITGRSNTERELGRTLAYVGFGLPGRAADGLGATEGWAPAEEAHRWAVRYMNEGAGGARRYFDGRGEVSLREYVRAKYGDERMARLWRSELPFEQAAPAVLGIEEPALMAQWRRALLALGPNPHLAPEPGAIAAALGWGSLLLLAGLAVARRREIG